VSERAAHEPRLPEPRLPDHGPLSLTDQRRAYDTLNAWLEAVGDAERADRTTAAGFTVDVDVAHAVICVTGTLPSGRVVTALLIRGVAYPGPWPWSLR
jgi:hypothetical protein